MTGPSRESHRYPLLESLLAARGLSLKGIYTNTDAAKIFGVSKRTILDWLRDRKLIARDLPGRGRFLSEDLELFLQKSLRKQGTSGDRNDPADKIRRQGRTPERLPQMGRDAT